MISPSVVPEQPLTFPDLVTGPEPVYLVAAMGDDAFATSDNPGRADYEACLIDGTYGRLACDTLWALQNQTDPNATFAHDALLYFSYLYPFYGVARETVSPSHSISHVSSAIGRYPLLELEFVTDGQIFSTRQSASTAFEVERAYYQLARLLAHVYVVGGYAAAHTDPDTGTIVPAGPTGMVERHQH